MILFISNIGESLPVVHRIIKEGIDAKIYIHDDRYSRSNYAGIFDNVPFRKLIRAIDEAELVIFDSERKNFNSKKDLALLSLFKVSKDSRYVFSTIADEIGDKAVGVSAKISGLTLEDARRIGIMIPKTYNFDSLSNGKEFLTKKRSKLWVLKSSYDTPYIEKYDGELLDKINSGYWGNHDAIDFVIQEKIRGVQINTEMWFDGSKPQFFTHTLEGRRLFTGDIGVEAGSQTNCTWIKKGDGLLREELSRLIPELEEANYAGSIGLDCIVNVIDKKPYFLDWITRFKYDALFNTLSLINGSIGKFFKDGFEMNTNGAMFCCSERVTLPPYPYADDALLMNFATGIPIDEELINDNKFWGQDIKMQNGKLLSAGTDGILGIVNSNGCSVRHAFSTVYRYIKKMKVASTMQFRIDGIKETEKKFKKLKDWSVDIY